VTLRFNDGVEIDPSGPLRIWRGPDGLYVIGEGMLCACDTREEAEELLAELRGRLDSDGDQEPKGGAQ